MKKKIRKIAKSITAWMLHRSFKGRVNINNALYSELMRRRDKLAAFKLKFGYDEKIHNELKSVNKRMREYVSDVTKQKLRGVNLGKKHSDETKRKMSESAKKRWANKKLMEVK